MDITDFPMPLISSLFRRVLVPRLDEITDTIIDEHSDHVRADRDAWLVGQEMRRWCEREKSTGLPAVECRRALGELLENLIAMEPVEAKRAVLQTTLTALRSEEPLPPRHMRSQSGE